MIKQKTYFNISVLLVMTSFIGTSVLADSFGGQVIKAYFTTKLKKGKPVNEVLILENNVKKIHFYSEIRNMKGKTISHNWEHRGKKIHTKKFKINKDFETTISDYQPGKDQTGEWMVVVRDDQDKPIKAAMFKYVRKGSFAGKGIIPIKQD